MPRSRSSLAITALALAAVTATLLAASPAQAQLLGRIRSAAKGKVVSITARTAGHLIDASGKAVDSTLEKGARKADTTVDRVVGSVMKTALDRGDRALPDRSVAQSGGPVVERLSHDLAAGRLAVTDVRFARNSDRIEPATAAAVEQLAAALRMTTGVFVVEVHVPAGVTGAQALSTRRAAALQERLVAAGVEPARLLASGVTGDERIEITRLR